MQFENKKPFRAKRLAQVQRQLELIATDARGPYAVGHGCSLLAGRQDEGPC